MKKLAISLAAAAGLSLALLVHPASAEMKDPSETLKVNFIIHAACGNVFFEPLKYGAAEAGRVFNVDVTIQCAENDLEAHVDLIETGIASGVDGIIDQISVPDTMTDAIQKARDAGITVIAASIDDKGTARQAFFGQDFVASGYIIGKRIVEEHGLGEGDFCVTPVEFPELSYAIDRYAGVKMALDEAGVESEMIGTGVVVEETQNLIAEYLIGNPIPTASSVSATPPRRLRRRRRKTPAWTGCPTADSMSIHASWRTSTQASRRRPWISSRSSKASCRSCSWP